MLIEAPSQASTPSALEAQLLDLFAPTTPTRFSLNDVHARSDISLWRLDAIHRARNLAQLSASLANLVNEPSGRWAGPEMWAPARALAQIYAELGLDAGSSVPVACFGLVSEVAIGLAETFGRARDISVHIRGDEVVVDPERRRVVVLMCSEFVINALKYAFPAPVSGTIWITLMRGPDGVDLTVEDDGVGIAGSYVPHEGGTLIDRLAALVGATIVRGPGRGGAGLAITVHMPRGPVP